MFVDLHTHVLSGVDDGPEDTEQMYELLDAIYHDGARCICCTPHYHPGYYGHNAAPSEEIFQRLRQYAAEKYPAMQMYLGNELHFSQGCVEWVEDGLCRTLNGTRFVLLDFDRDEQYKVIEFAVQSFLRYGYIPVLAHIERYGVLRWKSRLVQELHDMGAVIQVNAASILQMRRYPLVRKILQRQVVDVIASDSHGLVCRPPLLSDAFPVVAKSFGRQYAAELFIHNPGMILGVS